MQWETENFIMGALTIVVVTLILTAGGCTVAKSKMIAESADPIATGCAINGGREYSGACVALAQRAADR